MTDDRARDRTEIEVENRTAPLVIETDAESDVETDAEPDVETDAETETPTTVRHRGRIDRAIAMNEDPTHPENGEADETGSDPDASGGDHDASGGAPGGTEGGLPETAVEEAERLTRLAHDATDKRERAAYEADRDDLLAEHGFTARVRRDDGDRVLVCHPEEWVAGGSVRPDRVDDLDRAVEVPLSGAGDPEDWAAVDEHNREVAARIRAEYGDVHGENADAFADFMGNHYAKPVERATAGELREFLEEYFPRNAWPSDEQRAAVGRSVELVFEVTDEPVPEI